MLPSIEVHMARKMKGMTIQGAPARQGGVAPKGKTSGGGPNGPSGQSNSARQVQPTGIIKRELPSSRVLLQRSKELKAEVARDAAVQKAEKRGPSLEELRKAKSRSKF